VAKRIARKTQGAGQQAVYAILFKTGGGVEALHQ